MTVHHSSHVQDQQLSGNPLIIYGVFLAATNGMCLIIVLQLRISTIQQFLLSNPVN